MKEATKQYDAVVIGGGPSGATVGLKLARLGKSVLIIDRARHPRFHVGESMIPAGLDLIRKLGLGERLAALPHVPKLGAEFGFASTSDEDSLLFGFTQSLTDGPLESYNIERSIHDAMLLDAAEQAGAEVWQGTAVQSIDRLGHHDVALTAGGRQVHARWLLDASGTATLVGRHLGIKRVIPSLRKIAFFGHFTNVQRLAGDEEGYPTIVMVKEGWFWIIPINATVTSVGLVLSQDAAKQARVPREQMLRWAAQRCPMVARRLRHAQFPETNHSISDFSYHCRPYAGPGYFLIGDAATFLDPVFSTGVGLGMHAGVEVADLIHKIDAGQVSPTQAADHYGRFIKRCSRHLFSLVHSFYDHPFRELMMNGRGPFEMHRAIISLLAGHVFPKPPWSVVWRFRMMQFNAYLQRVFPLVPRHAPFSLLEAEADESIGQPPRVTEPASATLQPSV